MRSPSQSSRSPRAARNAGGWPVPSGMPSSSPGRRRAAASAGFSVSAMRPDAIRSSGLGAQAAEHDLEVALPAHRRGNAVAGVDRVPDAADQARDVLGADVAAELPARVGALDELFDEFEEPGTHRGLAAQTWELTHGLRKRQVLGGDPRRALHEVNEARLRIVELERLAGRVGLGAE